MQHKDYFLNETQRLAQLIAKLLGLKEIPDSTNEAQQVYDNALYEEYGLHNNELKQLDTGTFEHWLRQSKFSAAKLDTLAQLLYYHAEPFKADAETLALLQKVMIIFNILEQEHHQQSFENIGKRQIIQQYIKQHHA